MDGCARARLPAGPGFTPNSHAHCATGILLPFLHKPLADNSPLCPTNASQSSPPAPLSKVKGSPQGAPGTQRGTGREGKTCNRGKGRSRRGAAALAAPQPLRLRGGHWRRGRHNVCPQLRRVLQVAHIHQQLRQPPACAQHGRQRVGPGAPASPRRSSQPGRQGMIVPSVRDCPSHPSQAQFATTYSPLALLHPIAARSSGYPPTHPPAHLRVVRSSLRQAVNWVLRSRSGRHCRSASRARGLSLSRR